MSKTRYDVRMLAAWHACKQFNDNYPIGTPVLVTDANGVARETRTNRVAWASVCGSPFVGVEMTNAPIRLMQVEVLTGEQKKKAG